MKIDFVLRLQNTSNPYINYEAVQELMSRPCIYEKKGSSDALQVPNLGD